MLRSFILVAQGFGLVYVCVQFTRLGNHAANVFKERPTYANITQWCSYVYTYLGFTLYAQ